MEKAVVSVAAGTVNGLIGKLSSVLADEALLLGGVRVEIQYIKDELESMCAFLIVQAQKENSDQQVKIWMKQVREMAYDAEDCIDKFRYCIDNPSRKGFSSTIQKCALVLRTLKARHQIATQIRELKRRTRDVSERQLRYHAHVGESSKINSLAGDSLIPYPQLQALYPEQVEPVGFDKSRDQIIGWLTDQNRPRLTVISIVGFGGLGKTTLAKMAYENRMVRSRHFECRAFVAVSQRFDVKLLLTDILQQVNPNLYNVGMSEMSDLDSMENGDLHKLVNKLREYLSNKRYVIILDDIWDASAWEHFKIALPNCTNGSRIIVTTRIESVANECSRDREPCIYKMKPLDSKTSKILFYRKLFGRDQIPSGELDQVSNDILKKCGGMPLAINSVAGLLASKPKQPHQWRTILSSLGSELETNPTLDGMRKVLLFSYQNLPHYLKTCFLYLSIYPEDYEIRGESLMRRWIAEGFVSRKRGLSAKEVAESYLYELVNRSMVIPIDVSFTGEIESIRVHDMMLEIIVSMSLEENFVFLVGGEYNPVHDKIRRLSVHFIGQESHQVPTIYMNLAHIRSLTIFGNSNEWIKSKQLRLERVLDLEGNKKISDGDLKYLCEMFQLKYLSLRDTNIRKLPRSIRKLQNLETMDIRDTGIFELPSDFVKLQNLTHFYGGSSYYIKPLKLPQGMHNLLKIQTLIHINVSNLHFDNRELGKLQQITELGVGLRKLDDEELNDKLSESFCYALEKLNMSLRTLIIGTESGGSYPQQFLEKLNSPPSLLRRLKLDIKLERLPHWFPSLNNLTELTLGEIPLNEDAFLVLQKLSSLIILDQLGSCHTQELCFVGDGFPSLRVFRLVDNNSPVLRFEEKAAPMLEKMVIFDFTTGHVHFSGIEHLRSLKEVFLRIKYDAYPGGINDIKDVIGSLNNFKLTVEYERF